MVPSPEVQVMPKLKWTYLLLAIFFVLAASTFLVWYGLRNARIAPELANDLQKLIRQEPHLKPMYDLALKDGRITLAEAEAIVKAAETPQSDVKKKVSPGPPP